MKEDFLVKQFEDKPLAHYSYAILSEGEVVVVDPQRNPKIYYDFAKLNDAKITGIIETHPHADFTSSHLEIRQFTGAKIYVSKLVEADYPHETFDDRDEIKLGKVVLKAINTPGHSPDSISILLNHRGKDKCIFTGDTLFIGDCGRPDLREKAGAMLAKREELAGQMYDTLQNIYLKLDDDIIVYPAHGSGSLCGKALSEADSSTMGEEKKNNWSLQAMSREEFIKEITSDQPFIPGYFGYNVAVNKGGAYNYAESINKVKLLGPVKNELDASQIKPDVLIVDARPSEEFRKGHLPNSINLEAGNKFETWLGSIVAPDEPFYLAAADQDTLENLINRTAKIAYEGRIEGAFVLDYGTGRMPNFDPVRFRQHRDNYTIVDVRTQSEVEEKVLFDSALNIPLNELRSRTDEIPKGRPIVVHCAGGYRSAAGSSIIQLNTNGTEVFNMGEVVKEFNS